MKLKHKALVKVVYPKAVCHHLSASVYTVYDKPVGRVLGGGPSSWRAWSNAYSRFSTAIKKKAQRNVKA